MTPEEDDVKWQPLYVRDTPEAIAYETLVDGVPHWLERSIWRWLMDRAATGMPLIYKAERYLRINLHAPGIQENPQLLLKHYWKHTNDRERLALIDFLLRDMEEQRKNVKHDPREEEIARGLRTIVFRLRDILIEGGSLWTVTLKPYWSLVRRVNETTQAHVDLASSPDTDAARKIATAWHTCYRRDPDYDIAYRDAVLAVEAVTIPVTMPKSNRATLGSVVSHVANTVDKWTVGGLQATEQASGETLLAMLRTLWHNQQRHANTDGTIENVSQSEAEAAVGIAVTLVHWFSSDLAHRR